MVLRAAIRMNDHAIDRMQAGNFAEAVSLLRSALSGLVEHYVISGELRHCSRQMQTDSTSNTTIPRTSKEEDATEAEFDRVDGRGCLSVWSVNISRPPPPWNGGALSPSLQEDDSSFLPMYGRAFLVSDCCPEHREILAALILFNLALVYHARGILDGETSYLCLAHGFYKMTLNVGYSNACSQNPFVVLLPLVSLYNMAQVCSQLLALDEMQMYLAQLRHWLLSDEDAPLSSTLRQDDYRFLFLNTMLCYEGGGHLVAAPAA